ncbi:hypothetical protein FACS1894104_4240 [Actinomycetota bacterium]|nr:hypothetical protein FACS1894104_4240 [Actinomycetota bacterium]
MLEALKGYSLSTIMFRILFELVEQGKEMRASDLSWRLLVLFPEITTACNELEKRGLIKRYYDNSDHRVTPYHVINKSG